ncbi:MAG: hypothetical protein P1V36_04525 [Planctomycetota bacterium]|nr:hypothetical protein [Planctomycetota bacterium]
MNRERHTRIHVCLAALLALFLVACGGGSGTDAPAANTNTPGGPSGGGGSGGGTGGGGTGDPGMVLPPFDATTLTGGVLATFAVGEEKFRAWFTRAENTQPLVDAFAGTTAPITSVCLRLRLGAGAQNHNLPWSWSVDTILPSGFNGPCLGCANTRTAPSAAEAAVGTPGWLNCTIQEGNAVGFESRAFMQVTLIDLVDRR